MFILHGFLLAFPPGVWLSISVELNDPWECNSQSFPRELGIVILLSAACVDTSQGGSSWDRAGDLPLAGLESGELLGFQGRKL